MDKERHIDYCFHEGQHTNAMADSSFSLEETVCMKFDSTLFLPPYQDLIFRNR